MLAHRLRAHGERANPLPVGSHSFFLDPYGIYQRPGGGSSDAILFGVSSYPDGGVLTPATFQGYTVYVWEQLQYSSTNGTNVGLTDRWVFISLDNGPGPLLVTDITSVTFPTGSQTLTSATVDTFIPMSNGGGWWWYVPVSIDDTYPDYCGAGNVTVVV